MEQIFPTACTEFILLSNRRRRFGMRGEMTFTLTLTDADGGTDVLAIHDNLPDGITPGDSENWLANGTRETREAR